MWNDGDMRTFRNFINGQSVDAHDGRTADIINPVTGQVYATADRKSTRLNSSH